MFHVKLEEKGELKLLGVFLGEVGVKMRGIRVLEAVAFGNNTIGLPYISIFTL